MSLRGRLVVGMLVVLVAAIITTDVVTSSSLRSYLYGRLDEQVDAAQNQAYAYIVTTYDRAIEAGDPMAKGDPAAWLDALANPSPAVAGTTPGTPQSTSTKPTTAATIPSQNSATGSSGAGSSNASSSGAESSSAGSSAGGSAAQAADRPLLSSVLSARIGPDVYVEVIDSNHKLVFQRPSGSNAHQDPAPVLPKSLTVQRSPGTHLFGSNHGVYVPDRPAFNLSASGHGGPYYEAEAVTVPGGVLVTAIGLDPTEQTLGSLRHVEILVSAVVMVILLAFILGIVRIGLRPLEDMTDTARAIAAGDLTKRIRRSEERSEVGRLGAALNGMMSQIEAGFNERTVSESRLRRFVADASHELRTPLTSIRGYAELLRKGAIGDDEGRVRAAERIEHEAARMGILVDDLLLLARLDQGRPLERSLVDVGAMVTDAVESARAVQPGRPISLVVGGQVFVEGDAFRLRQVADNLLRNAALHTPPSTPVRVSVAVRGTHAVLEVADEGPGLDDDQAAKVFDRFYRGNEARTGEGTGLGLSIVAALASAHGGVARVDSTPGKGSVFIVELPLSRVAHAPIEDIDVAGGGDATPGFAGPTSEGEDVGGEPVGRRAR